jgi:uncharacterized protein (DUF305 family)
MEQRGGRAGRRSRGLGGRSLGVVFALAGITAGACRTAERAPYIVQPGAPGQPGRVVSAGAASDVSGVTFTEADVRFMQGMIGHHRQALEMTDLVAARTSSEDIKKLALRIQVSQADEIEMMQSWLAARRQPIPGAHAHHTAGGLMPGMLSAEEMERLAAASGREFERLFLEGMIRHHAGALAMVQQLFATPAAGQEADVFAFASDVEADQRMEIDRMSAMLRGLQK